jgi:hypothetical protein
VKSRHTAALALVTFYLIYPPMDGKNILIHAPYMKWVSVGSFDNFNACATSRRGLEELDRQRITGKAPFVAIPAARFADCVSIDAIRPTIIIETAIANHFHSEPEKRKNWNWPDRWYYGSHYLPDVLSVSPRAIISRDATKQPQEPGFYRYMGGEIGVEVDNADHVDEVKRRLPSQLDRVPVEVYPAPTNAYAE